MKNIFVGNLDFAATEASLRTLFEPHGAVERVSLVTDRDTGRSRGFAFVEMTDAAETGARGAGRAPSVREARPRPQGGGGRGLGAGGSSRGGGPPKQRREPRW